MALIATSCVTSSDTNLASGFEVAGTRVFVSENYTGYAARHIGDVVTSLEAMGFVVTDERESAPMQLHLAVHAGIFATVEIVLRDDRSGRVEVSSTNYGFGTWIARPLAVAGRVEAALDELRDLLSPFAEASDW